MGTDRDRWVYATEFREPGYIPTTIVTSSKLEMNSKDIHSSASPVMGQTDFIPMSNDERPAYDPPSYKKAKPYNPMAISAGSLILLVVLLDPIFCMKSPQSFCGDPTMTFILFFLPHAFVSTVIALLVINLIQRFRQSRGRSPSKLVDSKSKKALWCILSTIIVKSWFVFWLWMGQIKLGDCPRVPTASSYDPYGNPKFDPNDVWT
ncbi:MAG: hypothetical protein Q9160_003543 [Pyrenula sp. 1 TL-2023]